MSSSKVKLRADQAGVQPDLHDDQPPSGRALIRAPTNANPKSATAPMMVLNSGVAFAHVGEDEQRERWNGTLLRS